MFSFLLLNVCYHKKKNNKKKKKIDILGMIEGHKENLGLGGFMEIVTESAEPEESDN